MVQEKQTTDHREIRKFARRNKFEPALFKSGDRDHGKIGLMSPRNPVLSDEELKKIDWKTWFGIFEENALALRYEKDGNFNKLVNR